MKCSECGLCVSLEWADGFAWQCNLTGDRWTASSPAGINRNCFAPEAARAGFARRLTGARVRPVRRRVVTRSR